MGTPLVTMGWEVCRDMSYDGGGENCRVNLWSWNDTELRYLYFTFLPQTCTPFNKLPRNSTSCPSIQELGKIWHCVNPFSWPLVQTRVMISFLNFHNKIAALTYLHVYLKHVESPLNILVYQYLMFIKFSAWLLSGHWETRIPGLC